ncbi:ATP-binding protein [Rhodococcus oxybenzonivorans]|nr:ATP-binding protein [Rhodococcus oxybenzonivorans]
MSLRLVSIEMIVKTSSHSARYFTPFAQGFNVLNAKNSWGKSTLLQGIVYALGLEGAFSASRRVPLGPAMASTIDLEGERHQVVESYVDLTIANQKGEYLRVRRYARSLDVQRNLVQVRMAREEGMLVLAKQRDMFVRERGAATRSEGFHRLLEEFIGWSLPDVPTFGDGEIPLYLEVLLPLFFVEQKFGWSGIAPRVPAYLRIKDPLRRAVEYVLGLGTLDAIRRKNLLSSELAAINVEWDEAVSKIENVSLLANLRVLLVPNKPVSVSQLQTPVVQAKIDDEWVTLPSAQERWREEIAQSTAVPVRAGGRTDESRTQLAAAEADVDRTGSVVRRLREHIEYAENDVRVIDSRIMSIQKDKERLTDIRRIQRLGGEFELPLIAEGRCPTCEQELDSREVATDLVHSIEDNIAMLDGELKALESLKVSSQQHLSGLRRELRVADESLMMSRRVVRSLRDELSGPSDAPSVVEIERRLELERQLSASVRAANVVDSTVEELSDLAQRFFELRAELEELRNAGENAADVARVEKFRESFQSQLSAYGFRSIRPTDVTIDDQSLLPVCDGFELTFDVAQSSSASDTIRTKWAYHLALLEATRAIAESRHIGVLALDEPRQQETDRADLRAFLLRLAENAQSGQILYFTSEAPEILRELLEGIPVTFLPSSGDHLLSISREHSGLAVDDESDESFFIPTVEDVASQAVIGSVPELVGDAINDAGTIVGRALAESLTDEEEATEVVEVLPDAASFIWSLVEQFEGGTDLGECSIEADVILVVKIHETESAERDDVLDSNYDNDDEDSEVYVERRFRLVFEFSVTVTGESVEDLAIDNASVL